MATLLDDCGVEGHSNPRLESDTLEQSITKSREGLELSKVDEKGVLGPKGKVRKKPRKSVYARRKRVPTPRFKAFEGVVYDSAGTFALAKEIISPVDGIHSFEWANSIVPQYKLPIEVRQRIWGYVLGDGVPVVPKKRKDKFKDENPPEVSTTIRDYVSLCQVSRQTYVDIVGGSLLYKHATFHFNTVAVLREYLSVINPEHKKHIQSVSIPLTLRRRTDTFPLPPFQLLGSCEGLQHLTVSIDLIQRFWKRTNGPPAGHHTGYHRNVYEDAIDKLGRFRRVRVLEPVYWYDIQCSNSYPICLQLRKNMADVDTPEISQQEQHEETITDIDDNTGIASEIETEPEKEAGTGEDTPSKEPANGVKKENVPLKRPGATAAKRPGTASTSSTAKPAVSKPAVSSRTTGGLSKPPTRPAAGSAVRKPVSSATGPTAASSSHKSQGSIGGSADDKKPLAAAARRTSLAPSTSSHSPSKTGSAAEKRTSLASSTAAARKPATSISSTSPKPALKPTTSSSSARATTTTSTTSRSAPVSKPTSGAVADTKKRLSTISGSPSAGLKTSTRSTNQHAPHSSTEIDELKAKLEDSETRVEELKTEIAASQEKLLEFGKQVEGEAKRVTAAEENIRSQHNELIEKLHATHKSDVEGLQAQLVEAETAQQATQEASLKAIEEAKELATSKGASEITEILSKLEAEHASALEAIKSELASAKEASTATTAALAEKEAEIMALKSQLEKASAETVSLRETLEALQSEHETKYRELDGKMVVQDETHQAALTDLKKSLVEEHESALTALNLAHSAELQRDSTDANSSYQKQVEELTKTHEAKSSALEKKLEAALELQTALETSHKDKISTLETDLSSLKSSAETSVQALAASEKEIAALKAQLDASSKDLEAAQEGLTIGTKKLSVLEAKGSEDEQALSAAQSELAAARQEVISLQKMMDTFDADAKNKDEQHNKIKAELATTAQNLETKTNEITALQEKHKHQLEALTTDYEKEIDALQGNSGIREQYEDLKLKHEELSSLHTEATASHSKEVEELKQSYAAAIVALDNKEIAHANILEELKETHAKNLDEAHDRAINAGHAAHTADLEQMKASHADAIAILKDAHAASLASSSSDIKKLIDAESALQAEFTKTKEELLKTQEELDGLKQDLANEKMAKASAEAALDAATNKKPDTSEADALRKELQTLKDQHQAALHTAQQESAKATEEHLSTKSSLDKAVAELNKQKAVSETDYLEMHDSLTQLVEEANKKNADLEARLKEQQAVIKVKDAEIAEANTKSTPKKPVGLGASKFAEELELAPGTEAEIKAAEGEQDSSSAALATLAKARITLDQLDKMNEDMERDNKRSLQSITKVSPPLAT
ncbi:hypothetical protein B7494_g2330 [Chlorociboria aeruginascens]|nr:hypothetical protein B7494_g2330 [Chlorociboria aeruginascens]